MAKYRYKAVDKDGNAYEDVTEATDKFSIYRDLRERGQTVVYAEEVKKRKILSASKFEALFTRVKVQEKIAFARNLSVMIKAGLSITRALAVMEKQTKNKKLKRTVMSLNEEISHGKSLSDAMGKFPNIFPSLFVAMVKSGEESGNLADSLKVVALQTEKGYILTKKVKGAMIYPAIILSLMTVIGVLMLVFMVPTLTETFEGLGVDLPLSTRIIVEISDFLRTEYLWVILGLAVFVASFFLFKKNASVKKGLNLLAIKFPITGTIVKEVNAARTSRTLSSLLASGVDIVIAIEVTRNVLQNVYFKNVLQEAQQSIEKGGQMSEVFINNDKLYPVFVGEMIAVGEETGRISEMMDEVARFYEDEVDQKTKNMSTVIEPFLMIFMGAAVGFFAISMLAPTYSLVNNI